MTIIEALVQLRDDLKKWVANNLRAVRTIDTDIVLAGDYETIGNKKVGDKFVQGTNIQDILKEILTKRIVPTKPTPKIELSGGVYQGAYEVGTVITPEVICRLNPGKYSDNYPSQVKASKWTVSMGEETQTVKATEGEDTTKVTLKTSFTIKDSMVEAHPITIAVQHPAEDPKFELKDNLGGELTPDERTKTLITENMTKDKTTNGFTGFRYWFYGYRSGSSDLISIANINSDTFRKGDGFTTARDGFPDDITTNGMQQMFFAAPAGIVNTVKISNSINGAPQTVKKTQVRIKGNNDYVVTPNSQGMLYDLFYVDNDNADTSETTYTITTLLK